MRNATPVLPFKTRRPTRRHYFLRVNFRPFSFFTCTTHAKINPAHAEMATYLLAVTDWRWHHKFVPRWFSTTKLPLQILVTISWEVGMTRSRISGFPLTTVVVVLQTMTPPLGMCEIYIIFISVRFRFVFWKKIRFGSEWVWFGSVQKMRFVCIL